MSTGSGVKPATTLPREGSKEVIVRRVEIGGPRLFVIPGVVHIGSGKSRRESVEWVNQTGAELLMWFPNGEQVFEPPAREQSFAGPLAIPLKEPLILKVSPKCKDGRYRYVVYCPDLLEYAEGNSAPEVACP
jgi:hypothetical protein